MTYLDDLRGLQQVELGGSGDALGCGPRAGGPRGGLRQAVGLGGVLAGGVHHQIKDPAQRGASVYLTSNVKYNLYANCA